jgi:hypothetical protein
MRGDTIAAHAANKKGGPGGPPLFASQQLATCAGYEVFLSCATSASRILRYSPSLV